MINFTKTKEFFTEIKTGVPAMPYAHYHSSYELYYLEAGKRDYLVEDKFFTISAGDFVLIKPNVSHRTNGGYSLRTLVGFSPAFLKKTYTPAAIKHILKCFDNVLISPPEEIQGELKSLLHSLSKSTNPIDFASDLGVLLRKLSTCSSVNHYDKRISTIIKDINQNFSELHSIEEVADRLHISKYYLCRLFKDATGTTLIDYINTIKVKNACKFLETTNKDMLEISQICGFNSSAYFSNVFKKIMKDSPSGYRQKQRGAVAKVD